MTGELELELEVGAIVDECLDGHGLVGRGRGRTMTVGGRRRYTIRVQSDIYGKLWTNTGGDPYYPDLEAAIVAAIAAWRAAQ